MNLSKFSLNSKILPIAKANVSISNIEYQYGFGVYETIRVIKRVPCFAEEHIERLLQSAKIVGIDHHYSAESISQNVFGLITAMGSELAYNLKIILIGANMAEQCLLYIIPLSPLFPDKKIYKQGVSLKTVNYERMFPQAKTLNMLGSYLAYRVAKQNGYRDALLINSKGFITEGTRSNFFLVKGKAIFTPPRDAILGGVTKNNVLRVAIKDGFTVEEKNLLQSEYSNYDGAFITNTSERVVPINRIDNFSFSHIPESINRLVEIYDKHLENTIKLSLDSKLNM